MWTSRILVTLSCIVVAASALAQEGPDPISLKPIAKIPIPKPVKFNTKDFKPQIAPLKPSMSRISENEMVPPFRQGGEWNNLPVGTIDYSLARGEAPKISFPGIPFSSGWPPDCDMAVGPNHVVAAVNTAVAFFTKAGVKTFQANLTGDDFFKGLGVTGEVISDPRVMYDITSNRWFVHIIEVGGLFDTGVAKGSYQLIAVSDTSDPNGGWKKYRISTKITVDGNELWLDYPGVGVNKDGYVITGNMFGFTSGFTGAIFTIPKKALLDGTAGNATVFTDNNASTIMPARNYEPTSSNMYGVCTQDGNHVRVFCFSNLATTPQVQSVQLTVPSYKFPQQNAVGPNSHFMDGFGDARVFTAAFRKGNIVAAHNIQHPSAARISSRWYEISTNGWPDTVGATPSLRQSGNVSHGVGDAHMPAISVNKRGVISIMYTANSPSLEAQLVYNARRSTDPLGVMGSPVILTNSPGLSGPQPGSRWGDYFTVAVDPTDDKTFWGFGELSVAGSRWTTQVNSWFVPDASDAQSYTLSPPTIYNAVPGNENTVQGIYQRGSLSSLTTIDGDPYVVLAREVPRLGESAAVQIVATSPLAISAMDSTSVTVNVKALKGSTFQLFAKNVQTGVFELLGSSTMDGNAKNLTYMITNIAKYHSGQQATLVVRVIRPKRLKNQTLQLELDQFVVGAVPN